MKIPYYLSDILPDHRPRFLHIMEAFGVTGAPKRRGRANSEERRLSELPENLCYVIEREVAVYGAGGAARVSNDPFRELLRRQYEYDYHHLRLAKRPAHSESKYSSTSRRTARRIYNCNYGNVIYLSDMQNTTTFERWMNSQDKGAVAYTLPTYIHGMIIEGIHFNLERANELAKKFVEIGKPRPMSDPVVKGHSSNSRSARYLKYEKPEPLPTHHRYGYIQFGNFLVTTFAGHEEWLRAAPAETSSEEQLAERWRLRLLGSVERDIAKREAEIEKLNKKMLAEESQLGRLQLLERSARDGTNAAIRDNIQQLKQIPEIESFTAMPYGFCVITNNMLATKERTGEERYCGKFEIQVSIEGQVRIRNIASPNKKYRNPHGGCIGSFGRVFGSALRMFDYYTLVLAVMEYYRMFDTAHEGRWTELPKSTTPPKNTFVSEWHELVGDWKEEVEQRDAIEATLFPVPMVEEVEEDDGEHDD
jgi:hypothetical protein